jgi:3-isopropylmalate dehydrogenase
MYQSGADGLGAVGGPKWGVGPVRPEQGILRLRKALDLYANIRPANFASEALLQYSPLKPEIAKGTDIIVLRELVGGLCTSSLYVKVVTDDRLWKEAGTE